MHHQILPYQNTHHILCTLTVIGKALKIFIATFSVINYRELIWSPIRTRLLYKKLDSPLHATHYEMSKYRLIVIDQKSLK